MLQKKTTTTIARFETYTAIFNKFWFDEHCCYEFWRDDFPSEYYAQYVFRYPVLQKLLLYIQILQYSR